MTLVRLSHNLNAATPGFGGQADFNLEQIKSMNLGHSCNQSRLSLSCHIGTHVDAPFHFCQEGRKVTDFQLDYWVCKKPVLLDLAQTPMNTLLNLEQWEKQIPLDADGLFIRTGFEKVRSQEAYWNQNPGLTEASGFWLRSHRPSIKFVGFDFISLTAFNHREEGRKAHRSFLDEKIVGHPVMIVEDMALDVLKSSPQKVTIVPLFVDGAEGVPVTVLAEI